MGRWWYVDSNGKRKRTAAGIRHQREEWDSKPEYKKKNSARVAARRKALKSGLVHKGDGRDIDHRRGVEAGNGKSNIRVMSAHENRGRAQGPRKKGSKRKKRR